MHLYENRSRFGSRGIFVSLLLFVLIALIFIMTLNRMETRTADQQTQLLEDALRRAAVTCYAIEGRYPPSVGYIVDNYSVVVDEEKYIVSYDAFASNIMPSIAVLIKGASL